MNSLSEITLSPSNSVVLIEDVGGGQIPLSMNGASIAWTSSVIAVGCRMIADGPSTFRIGAGRMIDPGYLPKFDGYLDTPSGHLIVSTITGHPILSAKVSASKTRMRIWTNDTTAPDLILIGYH